MNDIPKVKSIVVHIGTEKTGTTTIQNFLACNRQQLRQEGCLYTAYTGANGGSQWGFVAAVQKKPWRSDVGARLGIFDECTALAYRKKLIDSIERDLREGDYQTLLISSEHFHSRLASGISILNLKHFLSRWSDNIKIFFFLRRQDRVAISRYSTKLKSGIVSKVFYPMPGRPTKYYDYELIYKNWSTVFGNENIAVHIYERCVRQPGGLLQSFCSACDISMAGKSIPKNTNLSLNKVGVDLLLELNRRWPVSQLSKRDPAREHIVARIAEEYAGRCHLATRSEAELFYAKFIAGNARLANILFPDSGQALFDDDFSDYPDRLGASESSGELLDAVIADVTPELASSRMQSSRAGFRSVAVLAARLLAWLGSACRRSRA